MFGKFYSGGLIFTRNGANYCAPHYKGKHLYSPTNIRNVGEKQPSLFVAALVMEREKVL